MKVFAALTIAAFAGSAVAQPIAATTTVHRRSVAGHNGTHYETQWKAAHAKYVSFKSKSESATAEAKRWQAIAKANKEAFDAYGTKEDHKKLWDDHTGERDALFKNFLAPKHAASSKQQKEYNDAQLDLDAVLAEYKANHTQRKTPIETNIADNKKGMADSLNAINNLVKATGEKKKDLAEYTRKFNLFTQDLADEVADYNKFKSNIALRKQALAKANNLWVNNHEVEWKKKSKVWNDNRDAEEGVLKGNHDREFGEWLAEKLEADVSNGHCPCDNGGTCTAGLADVEEYECNCAAGYAGTDCEVDIDHCANSPCQNGGVCVDGILAHTCQCAQGYSGTNCETSSGGPHTVTFQTYDGTRERIYVDGYGDLPKTCIGHHATCTITFPATMKSLVFRHIGHRDGWYFKMKGDVGRQVGVSSAFMAAANYQPGTQTTYGSQIGIDGDAWYKRAEYAWA